MAALVYATPLFQLEDHSYPISYYGLILVIFVLHQVTLYSMFVSVMAFFARISDPAVGGTYMTLLNTVTNLGKWGGRERKGRGGGAMGWVRWKVCFIVNRSKLRCSRAVGRI